MNGLSDQWMQHEQWPQGSDVFVEAFAKGLLVIAAFNQDRSLSLSEVSRRTRLPRAGVRRLLHTLVSLGMARQSGDQFMLTPRVLQLGFAFVSSLSLREVAQPVIETLSRESNEVVAISVLDGPNVVYVARAEVTSVLRRSLTIGSRLPAFCTSMGRVLLAGISAEERGRILQESDRRQFAPATVTNVKKLEKEIENVGKQGWSIVSEELELGACGIGAPIKDEKGNVVAAINLSTNLARHSPQELKRKFLPAVLKAAGQISQHLTLR